MMPRVELSRETRFALVPAAAVSPQKSNSWAGWPSSNLVVPHLRLQVVASGSPHPETGYLCNIKTLDRLLDNVIMEHLIPAYDGNQTAEALLQMATIQVRQGWADAMRGADSHAADPMPEWESLHLHLSPWLRYSEFAKDVMTATNRVTLTQQFEFSAAHRLHCNQLSDEENRRLFGKCNNPSGHGHNYVVEITLGASGIGTTGQLVPLSRFEAIVKQLVIDRLDHKHLNQDVDYFADTNPSVENIAMAIYSWLDGQLDSASLESVKVFETPKTWARVCGN